LRVFISNERLDAARYEGLTLIALDSQGGETPIYLPPNYIEGYRLAASGHVQPQGYQAPFISSEPFVGSPTISQPQTYGIESAPCPTGTTKQPDGTCLEDLAGGYPNR